MRKVGFIFFFSSEKTFLAVNEKYFSFQILSFVSVQRCWCEMQTWPLDREFHWIHWKNQWQTFTFSREKFIFLSLKSCRMPSDQEKQEKLHVKQKRWPKTERKGKNTEVKHFSSFKIPLCSRCELTDGHQCPSKVFGILGTFGNCRIRVETMKRSPGN